VGQKLPATSEEDIQPHCTPIAHCIAIQQDCTALHGMPYGSPIAKQVLTIEPLNTFEVRRDWKRPELSKKIFDTTEGSFKKAMDPKETQDSIFLTNTGRKAKEGEKGARKAKEMPSEWHRSVDKATKRNITLHASYDKDKPTHLQLEWSQKLNLQGKFSMGNSGNALREMCTWLTDCPFGYTAVCKEAAKEGLESLEIQ